MTGNTRVLQRFVTHLDSNTLSNSRMQYVGNSLNAIIKNNFHHLICSAN